MTDPKSTRDHFRPADKRDSLMKDIERQRAASVAKSAKLKALRLARDAAEQMAAAETSSPQPKSKPARRRQVRRLSYS